MIGRKTILSFFSHFFVQVSNGLIYLLAVNTFLPIQFGYYQIAYSIITIFTLISTLGFAESHVKIISESKIPNNSFYSFLLIKIIFTMISSSITVLICIFLFQENVIRNNREQVQIILILGSTNLISGISSVFELSFRGMMKFAKMELPIMIGNSIGLVWSLTSILMFKNFILYIGGSTIQNIVILLIYIYFARTFKFSGIDRKLIKKYFVLSFNFLIPIILINLRTSIGPFFFLMYFNTNILGVYSVILSFFTMLLFLEKSFSSILLPNLNQANKQNDEGKLKEVIFLYSKYMSIINATIALTAIIFGKIFLEIFLGEFYSKYGLYFFYFSLFSLLDYAIYAPYFSLIITKNKINFYTFIEILSFLVTFLSWIFFLPFLNICGIDLAKWLFVIPKIILIRFYCLKKFNIGKVNKNEFYHFSLIFSLIILSLLFTMLEFSLYIYLIFHLSIICIYIISIFSLKILTRKDIKKFLDYINPKEMINYIRIETKEKNKTN